MHLAEQGHLALRQQTVLTDAPVSTSDEEFIDESISQYEECKSTPDVARRR